MAFAAYRKDQKVRSSGFCAGEKRVDADYRGGYSLADLQAWSVQQICHSSRIPVVLLRKFIC